MIDLAVGGKQMMDHDIALVMAQPLKHNSNDKFLKLINHHFEFDYLSALLCSANYSMLWNNNKRNNK